MKKIFRSIIAILLCSFLFTINASAATEYKYDEKEVIESVEKMVKKLIDMNEAELEYYSENAIGWTQSACVTLLKYHENNTLGEFKNYGETELEEDGESLKITTIVRYEKADLKVITTMSYISGEIITTNVDFKVIETGSNTFGEKMLNALYNSLIGLCSVFVVLILISFIIYLFKFIPKLQEIFTRGDKNSASAALENVIAQIEENEELVDDTELVAVITAAICASTGATSDSFVVRSIKKADRKKKRI